MTRDAEGDIDTAGGEVKRKATVWNARKHRAGKSKEE